MHKCEWEWEDGVMVFKPTMDQFKDFSNFISIMETEGAHKKGLAKIIPPREWSPNKCNYNTLLLGIPQLIIRFFSQ